MFDNLHCSTKNRVIVGVCGGLEESLKIPSIIIRAVFIGLALPGGVPGVLLYLLLWVIMSNKPIVQIDNPKISPSAPSIISGPWEFVEIIETERLEENLGNEQRLIDNSKSISDVKRTLTLTKEWIQTYIVEENKTRTVQVGFTADIQQIGSIKIAAEHAIAKKFHVEHQTRRIHTEEISIDVKGGSKTRIYLHWKSIWQYGLVKLQNRKSQHIVVPFKIAVDLTFDLTQTDE